MALIARIQHPYIVEFKEAWVEKVRYYTTFFSFLLRFSNQKWTFTSSLLSTWLPFLNVDFEFCDCNVGLLCLHCYWILWRWRYVSFWACVENFDSEFLFLNFFNFLQSVNIVLFIIPFNRAELMKKSNGVSFPEEVI